MEARSLGGDRSSFPSSHLPGGAELIGSIGTDAFPRRLFASIHALTRAHHVTAFAFSRERAPQVLVAENTGSRPVSGGIAALYASTYWRQDLANEVTWLRPGRADRWMVRTAASEIVQGDYKHSCYTSVNLSGRVCVSFGDPDDCTRLSFYSQTGARFSEGELDNIAAWSDILISMLRKHASMVPAEPEPVAGFEAALRRLPEHLPDREVEVCDGILRGVSSEGIALKLGVSINTVRTYRKRAYARLGISSQNELMRRVMMAQQDCLA